MKKYYVTVIVFVAILFVYPTIYDIFTQRTAEKYNNDVLMYEDAATEGFINRLKEGVKSLSSFHVNNRERYQKAIDILTNDKVEKVPFLISAGFFTTPKGHILLLWVVDEDNDVSDFVIQEDRGHGNKHQEIYPYFKVIKNLDEGVVAKVVEMKVIFIKVPVTIRKDDSQNQNKTDWGDILSRQLSKVTIMDFSDVRNILPPIYMSDPNKYGIEIYIIDNQGYQSNKVKVDFSSVGNLGTQTNYDK